MKYTHWNEGQDMAHVNETDLRDSHHCTAPGSGRHEPQAISKAWLTGDKARFAGLT